MATFQNFRSAFNGFNREDVVKYIELLNNQHNAQLNQQKSELQTLKAELSKARTAQPSAELLAVLAQERERVTALERELAEVRQQLEQKAAAAAVPAEQELEAYRRAERAERNANERVSQLYAQANGILADAAVRAEESAGVIANAAEQVQQQLNTLQEALAAAKADMQGAAAALYAVRPLEQND